MKKDWVIWGGCLLLFFSGVLWGMIPDKKGFFVVGSVHDLFEIFGAIATVVTAFVAIIAINSWRGQFKYSEKYRTLRDFKAALNNIFTSWWYVSECISVLSDSLDKDLDSRRELLHEMTDSHRDKWNSASDQIYQAYRFLESSLTAEEIDGVRQAYWDFVNEVQTASSLIVHWSLSTKSTVNDDVFIGGSAKLRAITEKSAALLQEVDSQLFKYMK